jgi:hypothetical protein
VETREEGKGVDKKDRQVWKESPEKNEYRF